MCGTRHRCFRTRRLAAKLVCHAASVTACTEKRTSHSTRRVYAATLMVKRMSRSVRAAPPASF